MIDQSIDIKIKNKGEIVGDLSISSRLNDSMEKKFENIKSKKVKGMTFKHIEKDYHLDTKTPIQYCDLPEHKTNIFLLEETDYTLSFVSNKKFNNDEINVFDYLEKHSHGKSNIRFAHKKDVWICNVNFRGYAGKTFIDIISDDFKFSMMVEVRTKKLDYDNEYSQMIADLSKYSSGLLFNVNASLYQNHILSNDTKSTLSEYYMLLKYLFRPQNLPAVSEYLSRNLYSLLENTSELVPTSLAYNIGESEIAELSSNPQYISETTKEYSIYENDNKYYVPLIINQMKYEDNIDVPENRFYKYFLEFIRDLISKLYANGNCGNNQIKLNLEYFYDVINSILSHRYFKDISRLDYIPLNSQVLQKKEGYREILEYYLMFEFGLKIAFDDLTDKFRGFEKELGKIYEIWCYFQLIDVVNSITQSNYDFETFVDTEKWSLSLNNINDLDYFNTRYINEQEVKLRLMYNHSFNYSNTYKKHEFTSYSEKLDPDNTLIIEVNGIQKMLHFDAKYKLKNGSYNPEDIYKMHTYKDAINDSIGAYVLYPGKKDKVIFPENDGSYGSVGAFSLNPGYTRHRKFEIKRFIRKTIKDLIEITK